MRSSEGSRMMPDASKHRSEVTRSATASGLAIVCPRLCSISGDSRRDTRRSMAAPGLHSEGVHVTSTRHVPNEVFPSSLKLSPRSAGPAAGWARPCPAAQPAMAAKGSPASSFMISRLLHTLAPLE